MIRTGIEDETGGISHTFTYTYFTESQLGDFLEMAPGLTDVS